MSDELERRLRAAQQDYPTPDEVTTTRARDAFLAAARTSSRAERRHKRIFGRRVALVSLAFVASLAGAFGGGFSLGSTERTAERSAEHDAAGPGFIPAIGWNVLQTGLTVPPQAPAALAANVPFAPEDRGLDRPPRATIERLGPTGIVFDAIFYLAEPGAIAEDVPKRELPLRLADAAPTEREGFPTAGKLVRLHAVTGGYLVDVTIAFGADDPNPAVLASAQEQLARLVVPRCPTDGLAVSGDDRAAAAKFVMQWLSAHYIGRARDLEGASPRAFVIGADRAPHAKAAETTCGERVRGRMLEVEVTLAKAAHATVGPRPLSYFVIKREDGWAIWRPA